MMSYDQLRGCACKEAYATKEIAEKRVKNLTERRKKLYHIYLCPFCKLFHVGH